jgi:hypothetical protein
MRKCDGPNCNRLLDEAPETGEAFCSIECACYAGRFNVNEGRLPKVDKESKRGQRL